MTGRLWRAALAALGLTAGAPGAGAAPPVPPRMPVSPLPPPPAAGEHPSALFARAAQAWGEGRTADATFWLYVAQLRYRAHLAARPDLDPTGDPALFASLMESVGRPINEYAFGDVAEATAIIDRALLWDAANPVEGVPEAIRRETRAGLAALRDDMRANVDLVRAQRRANGLPNR